MDFTQSGPLDIRLTSNLYANHTVQFCEERGEFQYCYNVYPGAQSAPMTYDLTLTVEAVPVVPEPASLSLLGVAALVLGRRIRRRMV